MEDPAHQETNSHTPSQPEAGTRSGRGERARADPAGERPVGALSLDLLVRSLPPAERPGARRELAAELVRLYTRFEVELPPWLVREAGGSGAERS